MSDLDEKKPAGKAGKRKRNADQRNRKADHKPPKADQVQSAKAQIDALMVAPSDPAPLKATVVEALASTTLAAAAAGPTARGPQTDPIIAMTKAMPSPAVALDIAEAPAGLVKTSDAAPAAATVVEPDVKLVTADALPVVAPDVSEPSVAVMTAVETVPTAAPDLKTQVASAPPRAFLHAVPAPEPAVDTPVSLQTIAEAYGEFTRKSLEQTKCFLDKLTAVRSLDQAVEIQTEFARKACETFVAEAQKISELHRELARQRFERLGGFMSMGKQSSRWM